MIGFIKLILPLSNQNNIKPKPIETSLIFLSTLSGLLQLSVHDFFSLMFKLKLPVVDEIHPQSTKFGTGVKNKATGDVKLNESPAVHVCFTFAVSPVIGLK